MNWESEWAEMFEDLGDDKPTVCVIHRRFAPCRLEKLNCVYSTDPDEVAAVRKYQQGET